MVAHFILRSRRFTRAEVRRRLRLDEHRSESIASKPCVSRPRLPCADPGEYRAALADSRTGIFTQAESLVGMGIALDPRWAGMDSALLTNAVLSVAEMLGRLAVSGPDEYSRERLEGFVHSIVQLLVGAPAAQSKE
ncbi:hypothetical protein ACQPXH_28900 [Nocardia sp. CA-135953]|uniref:hypothetical protein n=1 Tax=Nocardia sp. CA-135953 TaxID=3239978 RepID=UPI003D96403A